MNELELVGELGDEIAFPEVWELSAARDRLIAAIAAETVAGGPDLVGVGTPETGGARMGLVRRLGLVRRSSRRRRASLGVGLIVAGAAIAAVLVAIAPAEHPHARPTRPATLVGAVPAPRLRFSVHPTAAQVLARAAFVVLQTRPVAPRPGQFVYTKTVQTGGTVWQAWLSVDGTRASRVGGKTLFGCAGGVMTFPAGSRACTPAPAYFPEMPTTSGAMLTYLERTQGVQHLNDLAKTVSDLLDSDYLLPAQQAALYRFLATTPGITVEQGVADIAGRRGIGVGWSFEGGRSMLIFDSTTFTYLGTTTWGAGGRRSGDALLQMGLVDRVGQLPAQSATATGSQDRA